jgi:hypothetical protein
LPRALNAKHLCRLKTEVSTTRNKVSVLIELCTYLFSGSQKWLPLVVTIPDILLCIIFMYCWSCYRTATANKPNNCRLSDAMRRFETHSSQIFRRHIDSLFECLTYAFVLCLIMLPYLCYYVILHLNNPITSGITPFAQCNNL